MNKEEDKKNKEELFDEFVASLPSSGYIDETGVTVVTEEWEE